MHKYGWIDQREAELLDEVLTAVQKEFGIIRFLEIGIRDGATVRGVYQRAREIGCPVHCEGIDIPQPNPPPTPDPEFVFHGGDSAIVWCTLKAEFNLLFIDGCHCCNHVETDFLNYSPLVSLNGYVLFHDTALSDEKAALWPQDHSYFSKATVPFGVREGLRKLGLLAGYRSDWKFLKEIRETDDNFMGMCLFQKIAPMKD